MRKIKKIPPSWVQLFCLLTVGVSSCVQYYHPPKIDKPIPEAWKNENEAVGKTPELPKATYEEMSYWWEIFNDEQLSKLEEEALKQSPTLQLQIARLQEARGLFITVRSDLFPHLDFAGSAERQHFSPTSQISTSQATSGQTPGSSAPANPVPQAPSSNPTVPSPQISRPPPPKNSNASRSGFTQSFVQAVAVVSYELDFWGKFYQSTQSALNHVKGSLEDVRTSYLLLTINIAQAYYQVRADDANIQVLERVVKEYRELLTLNKELFASGIVSDLNVLQAEINLSQNEQTLEKAKNERALDEDLLATLVGVPASSFTLAQVEEKSFRPEIPKIPEGMPADLLKKRPDIRQSEFAVESARLDVGVAKTAFFPTIGISGTAGYQGNKFSNLFKWKNRVWSATAALLQPIFDGGYNYGNYLQAKAKYQQAVAIFLNTVIQSYQDVEDSLNTIDASQIRNRISEAQLKSASEFSRLTSLQYESGIIDYLTAINAELNALQAESNTIQTKQEQVIATLSLIKSLGGSW